MEHYTVDRDSVCSPDNGDGMGFTVKYLITQQLLRKNKLEIVTQFKFKSVFLNYLQTIKHFTSLKHSYFYNLIEVCGNTADLHLDPPFKLSLSLSCILVF